MTRDLWVACERRVDRLTACISPHRASSSAILEISSELSHIHWQWWITSACHHDWQIAARRWPLINVRRFHEVSLSRRQTTSPPHLAQTMTRIERITTVQVGGGGGTALHQVRPRSLTAVFSPWMHVDGLKHSRCILSCGSSLHT